MKLHLGCGPKFIPGFFHVDVLEYDHVDLIADVSDLSALDSGSAELVYACHVLEHFGRHDYTKALEEWARVLQPGGVLRLAVPDFRAIAEWYLTDPRSRGIADVVGLTVGGQKDEWDAHRMIFDEESLRSDLFAAGFSDVRHWDWTTTEHAEIDDFSQAYLPHMDKENGRLMSLNLEATR